jgi:gliding motility-associated lipoprotein GldD
MGVLSCTGYTPKSREFFRIDIPEAHYREFAAEGLPFTFRISQWVMIELPPEGAPAGWVNLSYETMNAKVYCSYREITQATLPVVTRECHTLLLYSTKNAVAITEQSYEDPEIPLYATLFRIAGESVSPLQFTLTDSVRRFFRGALYYQCRMDADSLAPVTGYVEKDLVELIQSFQWK